jgi:hypothetical protein
MKKADLCDDSVEAAMKFLDEVEKYATESVVQFHADVKLAYLRGGIEGLEVMLAKSCLWDTVVDTYQQRGNRRFTR